MKPMENQDQPKSEGNKEKQGKQRKTKETTEPK